MKELPELSYVLFIDSGAGVKFTLNFAAEGSDTGKIEGLPATLKWDVDGNGTLTWSDGTSIAINIWELGD